MTQYRIFNCLLLLLLFVPSLFALLIFYCGLYVMCRVQDVAELLGMMIEDHKRLQPNVKTYA